jgi:ribosomal protein L37AE/L43A
MDPEQAPVNKFDPLLRDLLYWGLLAQVDDVNGHHWQLAERAELRLDEITAESNAFAIERMVYLDHRCDICGFRRLTRVRDSRYVCDECGARVGQPTPAEREPAPATKRREHRWIASKRQRTAWVPGGPSLPGGISFVLIGHSDDIESGHSVWESRMRELAKLLGAS